MESDSNPMVRAHRVSAEAALLGFDWENATDALAKVSEEVAELRQAIDEGSSTEQREELGDLLFAAVNVARLLEIDASEALSGAVEKFSRRFEKVRERIENTDETPALETMEQWWQETKIEEK